MAGSVIGYAVGHHGGRPLLDSPGRLEKRRRNLLAKGDRAFGGRTFIASVALPAFVSGVFKVRFWLFVLGAMAAGAFFVGLSYLLGEEVTERIGNADTTAIVSVLVIVAIRLGSEPGTTGGAARQADQPGQSNAKSGGAVTAARALRCNGGSHERHCPAARR